MDTVAERVEVCFVYPLPFGFFPELVEYLRLLGQHTLAPAYVGLAEESSDSVDPFGARIIHVAGRWNNKAIRFWQNRALAGELLTQVKRLRPRIVHAFHFRGCALLALMGRRMLPNTKWICDVRTVDVSGRMGWLKNRLTHLESLCFDHVLALTDEIARNLRPARRPPAVIPLGVSPQRFATPPEVRTTVRKELGIPADAVAILYAGTLEHQRKLDRLVRAFSTVCREDAAYLIVVGGSVAAGGIDRNIDHLRGIARELGVHDQVRFTGRVPYDTVARYFAAGDVGVSFVPMEPHFLNQPPTKLIEYMACPHLVPVCTATPASLHLTRHGRAAVVCDDSVEGLEDALRRAIEIRRDPARFRALREAADEAISDLRWSKLISERLVPYYRSVLTGGPA